MPTTWYPITCSSGTTMPPPWDTQYTTYTTTNTATTTIWAYRTRGSHEWVEITEASESQQRAQCPPPTRTEAEEKALTLLRSVLTQTQMERFNKDECIPVATAKGNKYLIKKGYQNNIVAYGKKGNISHTLCAHPEKLDVPTYDTMLSQLLFLLADEEGFLKVANKRTVVPR